MISNLFEKAFRATQDNLDNAATAYQGYALALAIGLAVLFFARIGSPVDFGHLFDKMERAYAQVDDYAATFLIQEQVDGQLGAEQLIALKFQKPLKVYMRWLDGSNKGRQALYPVGANGNELLVRVPMLVGAITLTLDPRGHLAMKGRRHPITDIGIGRLLDFIRENAHRGHSSGKFSMEDRGEHTTFDRPIHRYILRSPPDSAKGYDGMTAIIDVDREHRLPIYAQIFDGNHQLIERYGYLNLRLNPGFTDADFDPQHPDYGF